MLQSGFDKLLSRGARIDGSTHSALESAEESFHPPSPAILTLFQMFGAHPGAPFPVTPTIGPLSVGLDYAFDSPLFPALHMNPLGIVTRIGIQAFQTPGALST